MPSLYHIARNTFSSLQVRHTEDNSIVRASVENYRLRVRQKCYNDAQLVAYSHTMPGALAIVTEGWSDRRRTCLERLKERRDSGDTVTCVECPIASTANGIELAARIQGRGGGEREITENTHRPAASSGTIPTFENPELTRLEIEAGSPWWGASSLTTTPPRPPWHVLYRISNRQFRRFEMNFISISSPALNLNGATVFCVDLRSDIGSSFEPQWCNRALDYRLVDSELIKVGETAQRRKARKNKSAMAWTLIGLSGVSIVDMPRRHRRQHFMQLTERGRIVGLREAGWSFRRISQRVGREVSAVHHWWCRWSEDGAHARQPGSGRQRHTDSCLDRRIRRAAISDRKATGAQIRATVALRVSARNITMQPASYGVANDATGGMNGAELSLVTRADYVSGPLTDVCDCGVDQESGNNQSRHTGPTPAIMVWGEIAYNDCTPPVFVEGTLNSEHYNQNIIQSISLSFPQSQGDVLFQQDNARAHTSRVTLRALEGVRQLPRPVRSPDLSAIDHMWDMLGRRLVWPAIPATNLHQLQQQVELA
ncbi:hypothetical protein PR048_032627 [Dryococelus australis]|uniref:Tc1-like transposase DDE domain-containing protein n=1 Tax=Dryococelus australis TaxID=614101 RepID=A0ABQ9G2Q7_9NEOP|nr:hypothetical protein PR048_032627 [Dryococelus australis]